MTLPVEGWGGATLHRYFSRVWRIPWNRYRVVRKNRQEERIVIFLLDRLFQIWETYRGDMHRCAVTYICTNIHIYVHTVRWWNPYDDEFEFYIIEIVKKKEIKYEINFIGIVDQKKKKSIRCNSVKNIVFLILYLNDNDETLNKRYWRKYKNKKKWFPIRSSNFGIL